MGFVVTTIEKWLQLCSDIFSLCRENLPEYFTTRLAVTFYLCISETFSQQEVYMTWNIYAIQKGQFHSCSVEWGNSSLKQIWRTLKLTYAYQLACISDIWVTEHISMRTLSSYKSSSPSNKYDSVLWYKLDVWDPHPRYGLTEQLKMAGNHTLNWMDHGITDDGDIPWLCYCGKSLALRHMIVRSIPCLSAIVPTHQQGELHLLRIGPDPGNRLCLTLGIRSGNVDRQLFGNFPKVVLLHRLHFNHMFSSTSNLTRQSSIFEVKHTSLTLCGS